MTRSESPSRRARIRLATVALLVACGGSSTTPTPPPPPPGPVVASIEVTAPAGVLPAGGTLALQAVARTAAGEPVAGATFTWTTSSGAVATVSQTGVVRGVSAGSVSVTAAVGAIIGALQLSVRDTASLGASVSGEIRRVHLTVPAGTTHRIHGETLLWADSALTIAGTLELAPDASLTLIGERVIISGDIGPAAGAGLVGPARPAATPPAAGDLVISGSTLLLTGTLTVPGSVFVDGGTASVAGPTRATLTLAGRIETMRGRDGTALSKSGTSGGNIVIGNADFANYLWVNDLRGLPLDVSLGLPGATAPTVELIAGDGGHGYDILTRADTDQLTPRLLEARAGDGGDGGGISVSSLVAPAGLELTAALKTLRPGSGGRGGRIALLAAERLRDGTSADRRGESLEAYTGHGGRFGLAFLLSDLATFPAIGADDGIGGAAEIEGGNGVDGGPGGDITVRVGRSRHTLGAPPSSLPVVRILNAASGGTSTTAGMPGGDGGGVIITDRLDVDKPPVVGGVTFLRTANGGAGYNGCTAATLGPGTTGGEGGLLKVNFDVLVDQRPFSFNGGRGGDGTPAPGIGGAEGLDGHLGIPIGLRGADGNDCGSYVTASLLNLNYNVSVGTPCVPPAQGDQFTLTNPVAGTANLTVEVVNLSGISGIALLASGGDLGSQTTAIPAAVPANGTRIVPFYFNYCLASPNFAGEFRLTAGNQPAPFLIIPFSGVVTSH